ncbi:MAG: TIM barrel protein, partial [bacterium]
HPDARIRALAVHHLGNTLRFAAEVGAKTIVAHAGNVEMRALTPELIAACKSVPPDQHACERLRQKLLAAREKAAPGQLDWLHRGLDELLPVAESCGVRLALELLPSWEAIPTEIEMEKLMEHYASPWLRYWHDLGHGQIRENLGLSGHLRWLQRLQPYLAGMHVHDVIAPASDHRMPPGGSVNFSSFRSVATDDIIRVLEPGRAITGAEIVAGLALIRKAWDQP